MSLSSNASFNIQIDSEYRDISKYPTFTDFGIKFKNENTGTFLNGYPYSGTGSYNLETQIDPDFVSSDFQIINGSLQHIQMDSDRNVYLSGTIDILSTGSQFQINKSNYRIFTLGSNSIPNVFIAKFTALNSDNFYLSWMCYLLPNNLTSYRLSPTRSTMDIDDNLNIYWTFDCSFKSVDLFSTLHGIMYTIELGYYETERQYEVIAAFTNLGNQYSINGIPWGYHIISSNNDLAATLENGRNYIKTNTSSDIFSTLNTNPYDPYVYQRTGIANNTSSTIENSYMFMLNTGSPYYDGNPRYLYFRRISSSSIGFEYYRIINNEYEYITTFDNTTTSPWIPMTTYWSLSFIKDSSYIYIITSQTNGNMWLLRFNLTSQTMDLKYNQSLGVDPSKGTPPYIPTDSAMFATFDSTSTNIYIALSNVISGGSVTDGSLLYSLNASNPTGSGGAQLIYWDDTAQASNFGRTIDTISYNQYIIVGYQGGLTSSGDTIFKLYSYNTSSGTYISSNITEINAYKIDTINIASPTFFIDLNNNLCCCLTTIDRSIIFKINPGDLSTVYLSQVNNLIGNEVVFYGSKKVIYFKDTINSKLYLIGSGNGSITDISNVNYPYQLTTTYPKINDGYYMSISNVVSTPFFGNFLGGIFYPLSVVENSILFTTEFIDTPNRISSEHYTKPSVQYFPNLFLGYTETYKEMFSIEGYENNVLTNFSPSQFIGNGLVAWYNCRQQNNLIINSLGKVTGILDFSGNGLNLYADETLNKSLPTFSFGGVTWGTVAEQISSFSTTGTFNGSSIKFIIASYTSPITPSTIVQCYSGSNINAELRTDGVAMIYETGLEYTPYDSGVFGYIVSTEFNPVYFGYNTPESLQPYLAYANSSISFSDRGLTKVETSTNKISIMKDLTTSSGQPQLYELIILDFIPTQYQLSLFQSYFNSTVYTYPQIIPKLTGVFSVYTSSIQGPTDLYIKSIDGSSVPYNDLFPTLNPLNNFSNYIQVKYIRRSNSTKPNYICTICDDDYVRVYRVDDYFNRSYSYSQYDLSSFGWPLYSIEPYLDSSGNVKLIVSTYDELSEAGAGSPNLIHLSITESSNTQYDTITLLSSYTYSQVGSYYPNINTLKPYTYDSGNTYLFVIISLNFRDGTTGRIIYPTFYVYNITSGSFTQIYEMPSPPQFLPNEQIIDSAGSPRSSKIIKYADNNIYFVYKKYYGGNNKIYNITDPQNIIVIGQVKSGLTEYGSLNSQDANRTYPEFIEPIDMYVNPLTNNVYLIDNFYYEGQGNISFYNYTDNKSVSSEYFIPQTFYSPDMGITYNVSTGYITNIKTTVWNQKVWAMITFSSTGFINLGTAFIDVSNIEFVAQSYIDNSQSTLLYSSSFENIGIGTGIIHKINNNGNPSWLSTIGGDGTSGNNKWASNINISNIDMDNTLTHAYIVGSWKNKIQTFVNSHIDGEFTLPYKLNSITATVIDNSVNSFICKINVNDGKFVWLIPTFGTNDDYNQRVMFNKSNSTISAVSYFSSPVMLIYQPQQSSTGVLTNPINTVLNISNTSSFTSALFTFNSNGSFIWSSTLYSQEQSSKTKLYDLYIENEKITCIGITNANTLKCIDSTKNNVQNTYTSVNPINQQAIVIYTFDNNGIYQQSQKNELPPGMISSVFDINSYSSLNRIIYFINNSINANNGSITFYNKDGSLASTLSDYPINTNFSQIIQYKYDSSFTDTNGKKYSQLKLSSNTTGSLNNYKIFIQGGIVDNSIFESSNITVLNTDEILNTNFSIRSNSENIITLNSLITTNKIERYNLPSNSYWNSTISQTSLYGMISIETGTNNSYKIKQLFSSPPVITSTTGTYYVIYPNSSNELISIEVSSITEYRGLYTFTTTSPITNNINYPYMYLTTINKNANYTLQFYPGSLNKDVYFNISLTSLTLPNRPVKSNDFSGVRYLNDYPYIYLVVVNTDNNDNIDPNIFNNFYSNNIERTNSAIFTLSSNTLVGGTNFAVLTTSYTPKIKFSPGFYNIRIRLYDPDGNIIIYDNTPTISSDSVFTGGIVPDKLMRINLAFTLKPV